MKNTRQKEVIMKILFCTDGSEISYYAIKKTLPFLKHDYQIDITNVIDWGFFPTYVTFPSEEEVGFPAHKNIAENILDTTKNIIESEGYTVNSSSFSYGQPANVILDQIKSENYNLVVLGSHGKKGIKNWLGSVSRKVVTKSPIPVLIARPPQKPENIILKGSKNILITTDGSENSNRAIIIMLNILNLEDSSISVLNIKPGADSLPPEITSDSEWLKTCLEKQAEIANNSIKEAEKILKENNIVPKSTLILEGDAAVKILDFCNANKPDLIVMGSHGREGLADMLLGSVSKRVLDHSNCPILIVPTKKTV